MFIEKIKKRYFLAICYIVSLLPIFLPWCYFDERVDGIKCGTDIVNHIMMIVLAGVTVYCMIFQVNKRGKFITCLLLIMHFVIYFVYAMFWYVPLLTDFNFILSLQALHYGFYLSLLWNCLMFWFYVKKGMK